MCCLKLFNVVLMPVAVVFCYVVVFVVVASLSVSVELAKICIPIFRNLCFY